MPGQVLPRRFYARPTIEVARDLLGKYLCHGPHAGRIVEVEAYLPHVDEAAHSFRGRTARTKVIFGPPGHAYVYFIYGMHCCMNVVVEKDGVPGCVLIRGVDGFGDGPGKLTRSMGITLEHYGADLTRGALVIRDGPKPPHIVTTPRIGIRRSVELPLRFVLADS